MCQGNPAANNGWGQGNNGWGSNSRYNGGGFSAFNGMAPGGANFVGQPNGGTNTYDSRANTPQPWSPQNDAIGAVWTPQDQARANAPRWDPSQHPAPNFGDPSQGGTAGGNMAFKQDPPPPQPGIGLPQAGQGGGNWGAGAAPPGWIPDPGRAGGVRPWDAQGFDPTQGGQFWRPDPSAKQMPPAGPPPPRFGTPPIVNPPVTAPPQNYDELRRQMRGRGPVVPDGLLTGNRMQGATWG